MIREIDRGDIPPVEYPIRQPRPETAFAREQVEAFKESGLEAAEIVGIPAAYNTTRLYGSLKNAVWSAFDRPHSIRVMRRGSRLFLAKEPSWA